MMKPTGARRAGAVLASGLLGGCLALLGGPAQASTSQSRPPTVPAASPACSRPAPGSLACLALFRSVSAARRAGTPANSAGLRAATAGTTTGTVAPPTAGYGPAEIRSIYSLDQNRGAGQTVAVVDAYDNPHAEQDLAAFRSAYGLPACTSANGCFRKVNQRGGTTAPAADAGWGVEIDLDLQAVSAACPKCRILLVEANTAAVDDLGSAVDRAVALGARIVSNSYGGDEYTGVLATGRKYFTHAGVAMVVSSGDSGFTTASFPADWGSSIAVGGTSVTKTTTGWKQTAWNGSGSGCSAWIAKPAWQKDPHCLMRTVADLSALADPNTGLAVYDTFGLGQFGLKPGWIVVGGTSLAAPLVAGMIALAGNPAALSTAQYLYTHRAGLRDIVGGSNASLQTCGGDYLCTAVKGYDGPTGLGTPDGLSGL